MLNITEKKGWVNGHQVRGGWFHTFNHSWKFRGLDHGIMISWGYNARRFNRFSFKALLPVFGVKIYELI